MLIYKSNQPVTPYVYIGWNGFGQEFPFASISIEAGLWVISCHPNQIRHLGNNPFPNSQDEIAVTQDMNGYIVIYCDPKEVAVELRYTEDTPSWESCTEELEAEDSPLPSNSIFRHLVDLNKIYQYPSLGDLGDYFEEQGIETLSDLVFFLGTSKNTLGTVDTGRVRKVLYGCVPPLPQCTNEAKTQ
jgi:hypothetical protein